MMTHKTISDMLEAISTYHPRFSF